MVYFESLPSFLYTEGLASSSILHRTCSETRSSTRSGALPRSALRWLLATRRTGSQETHRDSRMRRGRIACCASWRSDPKDARKSITGHVAIGAKFVCRNMLGNTTGADLFSETLAQFN